MKKIISMVLILMVILTTTAFAYGKRGTDFDLTTGICVKMDNGIEVVSIRLNDEANHIIYFSGTDDDEFISMQVNVNGTVVYQEDAIYGTEDVISMYVWYVCYCVEQGWL